MSRKKKPLPLLEDIPITDLAAEGKAIARVEGRVVFVPWAVPGDVCTLQVHRKKQSFMEAEVVSFKELSPLRREPFCPHFGVCGGCKWQMLPYAEQLRQKQQQVVDALTRIGHLTLPAVSPILGSEQECEYRNKLEFGFSNKRWLTREQIAEGEVVEQKNGLGFHIPGAFDKILDIETCHLMQDVNNRLRNGIRQYALERGLTFFDLREQTGLLRNITIRTAQQTGEVMLIVQFCIRTTDEEQQAHETLTWMRDSFPEVTSLLWVNNTKCNDTIGDLDVQTFAGTSFITERMEDLQFRVGPKSFYQTNTRQAYTLYKVVRDFAALTGEELVYDLYTGTGTIAQFVARQARRVVGVEYVPEAIEDARLNAELNGLTNLTFYAGDMKDVLNDDFIRQNGRPDVLITDPPRAGMHPGVVETILRTAPRRIVYVSCNPATQARDLAALCTRYDIQAVQPVDMFPQTHHVENVCLLSIKQ